MDRTGWTAVQALRNIVQIDDNRLDTISLPLNLGLKAFHFVPIKGIGNILDEMLDSKSSNLDKNQVNTGNLPGER